MTHGLVGLGTTVSNQLKLGWDGIGLELSDGKILTTMEWLMVFAKVPL